MVCEPQIDTEYVREKISAFLCVPNEKVSVNISAHQFWDRQEMVVRALCDGLSTVEEHAMWPEDWWQAFKVRWFPAWLERIYPIRMQRMETHRWCPHLSDTIRAREWMPS